MEVSSCDKIIPYVWLRPCQVLGVRRAGTVGAVSLAFCQKPGLWHRKCAPASVYVINGTPTSPQLLQIDGWVCRVSRISFFRQDGVH